MEPFDIFIMFVLLCIIGIILGLNIVSVVDKKLGNVQVNIPPIPKPSIMVKINKNNSDDYNVYVSDGYENTDKIEKFDNTGSALEQIVKTHETAKINQIQNQLQQVHGIKQPTQTTQSGIQSGAQLGTQSGTQSGTQTGIQSGAQQETQTGTQPGTQTGAQQQETQTGVTNAQQKDDRPDKYEKDGYICYNKDLLLRNKDIVSFYSNNYVAAVLEDRYLKGANIQQYNNASPIDSIGKIPVDNYNDYPRANNYILKH